MNKVRVYMALMVFFSMLLIFCSSAKKQVNTTYQSLEEKDSLIVYTLPPQSMYLIDVNATSIKKMSDVKVIKSVEKKIFNDFRKSFIADIEADTLKEINNVDARILLVFKSKENIQEVLINKFGYFEYDGIVYDGNPSEMKLLQDAFPKVLLIKDLKW